MTLREKIVDIETGEETWRDYTPAEMAEVEKAQALAAQRVAKETELAAKKVTAEAKLAALGLTIDDLKVLGLA